MNHIYTIKDVDLVLSKIRNISRRLCKASVCFDQSGKEITIGKDEYFLVVDDAVISFDTEAERDVAHTKLLQAIEDYYEDTIDVLTHIRTKEW